MSTQNSPDPSLQKLILIGAGGFGYELRGQIHLSRLPFDTIGFLDNNKTGPDIIGPIEGHQPLPDVLYISALGDPAMRFKLTDPLEKAGARFANVVSPFSGVDTTLPANGNVIVLGGAGLNHNVKVGRHTVVQGLSITGHDATVGEYCTIGAFVFIGGNAQIGSFVTIHPHASILPGIKVGDGAVIGAGSVVIKDVEAHTTVFGNPAKVIERRTPT